MKYIILLCALALVALGLMACSGKVPEGLGMKDGSFSPCPDTPNCVSSQAADSEHHIAAIKADGSVDVVMVDLANSIESMFGGKVVTVKGHYLRAEFTSRIMRFVDDVECFYVPDKGVIEIRSASRVGYADFNANRNRVEELRRIFMTRRAE
jgi:uncharacterized protein (DUF1499 family)